MRFAMVPFLTGDWSPVISQQEHLGSGHDPCQEVVPLGELAWP